MAKPPPPVEIMTTSAIQEAIAKYHDVTPPLPKKWAARLFDLQRELSVRHEDPPPPRQEDLWERVDNEDRRTVEGLPPRHDPADR